MLYDFVTLKKYTLFSWESHYIKILVHEYISLYGVYLGGYIMLNCAAVLV